jgi:hypothetical protein
VVRLQCETQYWTHREAVKMSFRRTFDFLPCSGSCKTTSIVIEMMGPADLQRGQRGELITPSDRDIKHNIRRTAKL